MAVIGLLTGAAVAGTTEVAHANISNACGGNGSNGYICNLEGTIPTPGAISVSVDSGAVAMPVDVTWTVTCGTNNASEAGATDNADTPLTVDFVPLPSDAGSSTCTVSASVRPDARAPFKIDFTSELDYTPASASSGPVPVSGAVHPVKGFAGKCLDDKGNSSANRAQVVIWTCSSSDPAQNWKFSGNELIHNGKCLNDQGNGGSRTKVILWNCNGSANEKWSKLANGEIRLQSHGNTLCLDDPGNSTKNGTRLIVYTCQDTANQQWSMP